MARYQRGSTLLVTGFEPFGGSLLNPSALVLERLSAPVGWHLAKRVLPVDTLGLPSQLEDLLRATAPNLVLALGEARGSQAFRVETTARNRLDFSLADNAGVRLRSQAIQVGGPDTLAATLNVEAARERLRELGFEADCSNDAGSFLCNQLFYWLCHHFHGGLVQVGFLHLPSLPEQGFGPGLALEAQSRAVQAVLELLTELRALS